jgi:hypothetical protein
MMDAEFDYLDTNSTVFSYHVSPQEPGFRLEVSLLPTPTRPVYPREVEFLFYYRGNVPVVAIEGREQPYLPGIVRTFYQQFDVPPASAAQEPRHDGPAPVNRPDS